MSINKRFLLCHPVVPQEYFRFLHSLSFVRNLGRERDPVLVFLDSGLHRNDKVDGLLRFARKDRKGG